MKYATIQRLRNTYANFIRIECCFTPLSTVFQSYHGDRLHYSCLSWVSPVLGWVLKCLAQGHTHAKTQRIQCGSNPGPLGYESKKFIRNYLSKTGPDVCRKSQQLKDETFETSSPIIMSPVS